MLDHVGCCFVGRLLGLFALLGGGLFELLGLGFLDLDQPLFEGAGATKRDRAVSVSGRAS